MAASVFVGAQPACISISQAWADLKQLQVRALHSTLFLYLCDDQEKTEAANMKNIQPAWQVKDVIYLLTYISVLMTLYGILCKSKLSDQYGYAQCLVFVSSSGLNMPLLNHFIYCD